VRSPGIKAVLATMSLGAVLVACSASRDTPVANATPANAMPPAPIT
jgi:hypothetical protein